MTDALIIDTGCANLNSVMFACERLGKSVQVTREPEEASNAPRLILPGVGAAPAAMASLTATGMDQVLRGFSRPLFGICLGMQLLFDETEEGPVPSLGLLPGRVTRLSGSAGVLPHMGWNTLQRERDDPLLAGLEADTYAYFVHTYAVETGPATLASTAYGTTFSAIVGAGNVWGCQFHPERSSSAGARILDNFLGMPI